MILLLLTALASAEEPDLPEHMQGHFAAATDVAWFAAIGDLERAQESAGRLDHDASDKLPKKLVGLAEGMRAQAETIAEAETLPAVVDKVGDLGLACAACHTASNKGPTIGDDEMAALPDTPTSRHMWGFYSAWTGLVAESDLAWTEGAARMGDLPAGHDATGTSKLIAERYAALVDTASKAEAPKDRASALTQVIGTCPACHGTLGVDLRNPTP